MTEPAISVEHLSKRYSLHAGAKPRRETLLATVAHWALSRLRGAAGRLRARPSEPATGDGWHWALRDVSFSVAPGEVVGIIGRNGAGKSTLLKILSRITHPTAGVARVRGRMASLLEVGTGFHPDLSGRDNVLMNAAILGMTRAEIDRRFDEIVEFSGVGEYIDTPIKHYSSGMKVRLAFSVAAHLDAEILVIDEVLAVGDAEFQKKCLNRMDQAGQGQRTILFVSHNMAAVTRLCTRVIWFDQGGIVYDGEPAKAIGLYQEKLGAVCNRRTWDAADAPGDDTVRLLAIEVLSDGRATAEPISVNSEIRVRLRYRVLRHGLPIMPSIHLFDPSGTPVMGSVDDSRDWHAVARPAGEYETVAVIPGMWLNEGGYSLGVSISTLEPFLNHLWVPEALYWTVFDPLDGTTPMGRFRRPVAGPFRPRLQWLTRREAPGSPLGG